MVPTIDVSVFAYLTVIGAFLKSAMSWVSTGLDWLYKKCLAVFIGSKFWTFTVCLAFVVLVFGFVGTVVSGLISYLLAQVITASFPDLGTELAVARSFFLFDDLIDLISYAVTCLVSYAVAVNSVWVLRHFSGMYAFLFKGVKL